MRKTKSKPEQKIDKNRVIYKGLRPEGMAEALKRMGYQLRYNVRNELTQIAQNGDWINCNDRNMAAIRYDMASRYVCPKGDDMIPLFFGKDSFLNCRDALCNDLEIDPFREWLESLPPVELDAGKIEDYGLDLDYMFTTVFDQQTDTYARHISRCIVLGAVQRAFEPACKLDEIPVIQGGQGFGKDSLIKSLLPDESYFTDRLSFAQDDKVKAEISRGKVFVCASEMGGVTTTKDLEALKSWITATHDRVRLAYRRDADDIPRRFMVVGTTNSETPLPPDPTGNRRWMVVKLEQGAHVEPVIEKWRITYWQQAIALYRAGVSAALPREMKTLQTKANATLRRADDQVEDSIIESIETTRIIPNMTLGDIAVAIGMVDDSKAWVREDKRNQHRLKDALIALGFKAKRKRIGGLNPRLVWTKGDDEIEIASQSEPLPDGDIPF